MKKKNQEKRLGFNFLLSYYEVFKRLPDAESKEKFITSLCEKQFFGKDPKLNGIVEFAYASQKHSIDKSRKGWDDSLKKEKIIEPKQPESQSLTYQPLGGSLEGSLEGCVKGPTEGPTVQEKEEEKEKEQEEVKVKEEEKEKFLTRIEEAIKRNNLDRDAVYDYMLPYLEDLKYEFTNEERKKISDDLLQFKIIKDEE
jgi:hypothetical protein